MIKIIIKYPFAAIISLSVPVFFLFRFLESLFFSQLVNFEFNLYFSYLSIYICLWIIYFASKDAKHLKFMTLRNILSEHSHHWDTNAEITEISLEKSRTSITAIAMLIGVSYIGVSAGDSGLVSLTKDHAGLSNELFKWKEVVLWCLVFFSSMAIINFIISADSLDCMFNDFKKNSAVKLRRFFYKSQINPRYIGLVCLLTSVILLNTASDVSLGTLTIGIIIATGYRHWFPNNCLNENHRDSIMWAFFRFVIFICLPLFVVVHAK